MKKHTALWMGLVGLWSGQVFADFKMGLQTPPVGDLDFESAAPFGTFEVTAVDWRDKDGINWLGPVLNQGNCGSCVAFATVSTMTGQASIDAGAPWLKPSLSPQMLFACGGGSCDSGWMPSSAARYIRDKGVVDEACMPYTSGSTGDDVSCATKCSDSSSRLKKIISYSQPTRYGGSIETVKEALNRGPLVTTLRVYDDFVTYSGGIYKRTKGDYVGGHAITLIGYDDAKRAWLIQNSWGKEWGENGYGWVSWDDTSGVGSDTWHFNSTTEQSYVSVTAPFDKEYVSGIKDLSLQTQGYLGKDFVFNLKNTDKGFTTEVRCENETAYGCSAFVDTTRLPEGRYEIQAGSLSMSAVKSQVREFYVTNSIPEMKVSFTGAGVDLSKPVSGRAEFMIEVEAAPVPVQRLEFRVINKDDQLVVQKSNDSVLPKMKMGWRSKTVPNGQYKILFHAETVYKGRVYSTDSDPVVITVKN